MSLSITYKVPYTACHMCNLEIIGEKKYCQKVAIGEFLQYYPNNLKRLFSGHVVVVCDSCQKAFNKFQETTKTRVIIDFGFDVDTYRCKAHAIRIAKTCVKNQFIIPEKYIELQKNTICAYLKKPIDELTNDDIAMVANIPFDETLSKLVVNHIYKHFGEEGLVQFAFDMIQYTIDYQNAKHKEFKQNYDEIVYDDMGDELYRISKKPNLDNLKRMSEDSADEPPLKRQRYRRYFE